MEAFIFCCQKTYEHILICLYVYNIKVITIKQIAPGIPSIPTIIAVKKLSPI